MIIFPEMEIRIIDRDKILKGILIINFKVPRSYIIFSSGLAVPDEDVRMRHCHNLNNIYNRKSSYDV